MDKTIDLKGLDFNHVSFSLLVVIFVSFFAAALTTAYTGLLKIDSNYFGFPFTWKIIISLEPVFQAFGFIIDVVFWSALYCAMLWAIILLRRQFN